MPVGRRPVLAAAIALEAVALVLFISAGGVPVLLLARVAQGVATGAAITTLAATLVDLNPAARTGPRRGRQWRRAHHRPRSGALGCGALVQFAPAPTHLIYALLLGGMDLMAVRPLDRRTPLWPQQPPHRRARRHAAVRERGRDHVGLRSTAVVYGLGVVALGLTALAGQRMRTVGP